MWISKVPIFGQDMFAGWYWYRDNQIHLSVWFFYPFTNKTTQMFVFVFFFLFSKAQMISAQIEFGLFPDIILMMISQFWRKSDIKYLLSISIGSASKSVRKSRLDTIFVVLADLLSLFRFCCYRRFYEGKIEKGHIIFVVPVYKKKISTSNPTGI